MVTLEFVLYSKPNEMHFLYSVYYELTASTCSEHYLLIFRSRRTNNNWYFACVLCMLAALGLECNSSTPNLVAANRQHARKIRIVVCEAPPEDKQVVLETFIINWVQKVHLVGFIILIYIAFGKSLCTYKRCWKWCTRASIQARTRLFLFANTFYRSVCEMFLMNAVIAVFNSLTLSVPN
jgi:hypothetical protein